MPIPLLPHPTRVYSCLHLDGKCRDNECLLPIGTSKEIKLLEICLEISLKISSEDDCLVFWGFVSHSYFIMTKAQLIVIICRWITFCNLHLIYLYRWFNCKQILFLSWDIWLTKIKWCDSFQKYHLNFHLFYNLLDRRKNKSTMMAKKLRNFWL